MFSRTKSQSAKYSINRITGGRVLQSLECHFRCDNCSTDNFLCMYRRNESRFKLRWREIDSVLQHLLEKFSETNLICHFDRVPVHRFGLTKEGCEHGADARLLDGHACLFGC